MKKLPGMRALEQFMGMDDRFRTSWNRKVFRWYAGLPDRNVAGY